MAGAAQTRTAAAAVVASVNFAAAHLMIVDVPLMNVVWTARASLNVFRTVGLVSMINLMYRQGVSGKVQMTIVVFLTRRIKLACGFCSTSIQPALRVLNVHQAVVERGTATAHSGKQRHVEMPGSSVAYVIIMDPRNCQKMNCDTKQVSGNAMTQIWRRRENCPTGGQPVEFSAVWEGRWGCEGCYPQSIYGACIISCADCDPTLPELGRYYKGQKFACGCP